MSTSAQAHIALTRRAPADPLIVYACFTEKTDAPQEEIEKMLPAHKAWAAEREAAGDIFIAGPFLTEDLGYAGEGLLAFRAESAAAAEALAATDPMHASGIRRFRIRPWRLNDGIAQAAVRHRKGTHHE